MIYAGINYGLEEDEPGKWRWRIYPKVGDGPKVIGQELYATRDLAEAACKREISDGLSGKNNA
jgi:hypothetical protein